MLVAMSAMLHWMPWKSARFCPNASRCLAYCTDASYAAWAMPTHCAAMGMRLALNTCIVSRKPSPSAPRRFPSGTLHSSNTSSAVDEARMPILPCCGLMVNPGVSRETTSASIPRVLRLTSWVARTTKTSASAALVVNSLVPLST